MEQLAEVHVLPCQSEDSAMSFSERSISNIQMQYFLDVSTHEYTAVRNLRLLDDVGKVHCAFVTGKTKNYPLK